MSKLNIYLILIFMNIPSEANEIIIAVILISVVWALVIYLTKNSNYRSSRNKRARKQF